MSTITSKQQKGYGLIDPIFVLFFSALVILAMVALSTGNVYHLVEDVLGSFGSAPASVSVNNDPTFASDQRYWAANCSTGWSSDSLCDTIVLRTQSCRISADSAYCSDYKSYLQQIGN